ncbi:hypothetical protein ACFQAS_08080 [Halopenitus salinus]|uniref:Uncharacterized protein n=1 Tax=Halopenitus salinus TaxID=1198295 RepID=A0ABD5UVJ0_9EURY
MSRSTLSIILASVLVATVLSGVVLAKPPGSGSERNGLTGDEVSTLWSRDSDEDQDGGTSLEQLASGTDITFKEPPRTAATWSEHDFDDLEAGDIDLSVYPPSASREDGSYIKDAHATIFGVHPSTRGHLEARRAPLYIAPAGTLRGFVDYRIDVPRTRSWGDTLVYWTLLSHDIERVSVKLDGETVASADGTHTPSIDYDLDGSGPSTLTIDAEIRTRLRKTVVDTEGSLHEYEFSYHAETVHVSDSVDVEVYTLDPSVRSAHYPNGDSGAVITQTQPWHGVHFSGTAGHVRGVWRYYTARDTDWDTLVRSTASQTEEVPSDALPVYVHAYPSAIGPRSEPVRDGPTIIDTWGIDRGSPNTIGPNVTVDAVDGVYTDSTSIATRTASSDLDHVEIRGLVRGESTIIPRRDFDTDRELRQSDLSVTTLRHNATAMTVQIELTERPSGSPIALHETSRSGAGRGSDRSGYVAVGDRRVKTNESGLVVVTVADPGIHTIRYHPGSWLTHEPAYVGETTTLRFHPLASVDGIVAFLIEVMWQLLPFVVMFYAGHRVLRQFGLHNR